MTGTYYYNFDDRSALIVYTYSSNRIHESADDESADDGSADEESADDGSADDGSADEESADDEPADEFDGWKRLVTVQWEVHLLNANASKTIHDQILTIHHLLTPESESMPVTNILESLPIPLVRGGLTWFRVSSLL